MFIPFAVQLRMLVFGLETRVPTCRSVLGPNPTRTRTQINVAGQTHFVSSHFAGFFRPNRGHKTMAAKRSAAEGVCTPLFEPSS